MPPAAPFLPLSMAVCRKRTDSCFRSRFTGDLCVAVFDRAFVRLRVGGTSELVRHAEFLDALDEYDIVLTGPPA